MLKLLFSAAMLFTLALPVVASCQSKDGGDKQNSSTKHGDGPVIHRVGDRLEVIEHGDTLTWTQRRSDTARRDTAIYVFKGDSAIRLRPGPPQPISKVATDRLKTIRDQLRQIDAMDADLSKILR